MPVCLVNSFSSADGGGSVGRATVIVTPVVLDDASDVPPPPPLQPAASTVMAASPATPSQFARDCLVVMVLDPPLGLIPTLSQASADHLRSSGSLVQSILRTHADAR